MSSFSNPAFVVEDETTPETVHFTLKWSIQHFELLKNKNDFMYSSGITMAELGIDDYQGRWRICVKPCNSVTENSLTTNYVSVYLCFTDEDLTSTVYTGKRECYLAFKKRLTTGKLMDVPVSTDAAFSKLHKFSSNGNNWGYGRLINHQDLFGSGAKALKDSCLHIATDVVLYREPKTSRISEAVIPSLLQRYQEFLGRQLKQQEAGGNFLLVSNDNKEYHVDRTLLKAQSPIFAAMLNPDSKEKQTSRCNLKDVDGECLEILREYVFGCETGKIQQNNAEKVLVMADKYQMMDLRGVCERTLANNITVGNVERLFVLARQRNLDNLKDVAMQFIQKYMDWETFLQESLDL